MGIMFGFGDGKAMLGGAGCPSAAYNLTSMAFIIFTPLLSDLILLTRLFALYPLSSTSRATLLKIYAFSFCVKCARIAVLILFLNDYSKIFITRDGTALFSNPKLITEWALQIADNTYSVSFFLYNLHVRTGSIKRASGMPARIRQIFYISAANFVLPLIFSIALIILFMGIALTSQAAFISGLMLLINSYVTVMGVLCATVWFSRSEWVGTRNEPLLLGDMIALKQSLGRVYDAGGRDVVVGKKSATPNTANLDTEPRMDCEQPTY